MIGLLKTFGKGILYVLGFPFFLVALVLFGVIGLFVFIFQLIRSIIFFFTGQKFFPELPEDRQLRLMREGPEKEEAPASEMPTPEPAPQPQKEDPIIFPFVSEPEEEPVSEENILRDSLRNQTVEEACFKQEVEEEVQLAEEKEEVNQELSSLLDDGSEEEEELSEDSSIEESQPEEPANLEDDFEETVLETSQSRVVEEEEEEELEQYIPKSSNYSDDLVDDDDTDDDGGVDIKYDV